MLEYLRAKVLVWKTLWKRRAHKAKALLRGQGTATVTLERRGRFNTVMAVCGRCSYDLSYPAGNEEDCRHVARRIHDHCMELGVFRVKLSNYSYQFLEHFRAAHGREAPSMVYKLVLA